MMLAGVGALLLYAGTYLVLRAAWSERWEHDGHWYVLFPKCAIGLYYALRPLSYLDQAVTGIRCHVGPHQEF